MGKKANIQVTASIDRITGKKDQFKQIVKETEAFYDRLESSPAEISIGDTKGIISQLHQIRKEYEKITNSASSNHGELEFAKILFDVLDKAESKFGNISVMFKNVNDGTKKYVTGLSDIMQKLDDSSFGVNFLDIGSKFGNLQEQATELFNTLKSMNTVQLGRFNLDFASMNMSDLIDCLGVLRNMQSVILDMSNIDLQMGEKDFIGRITPGVLSGAIEKAEADLEDLRRLRLDTTAELRERRKLISQFEDLFTWDDYEHERAKKNIHNDEIYQDAISDIKSYIQKRQDAIEQFQNNEAWLFATDGISKYVDEANEEIERLQGLMKELQMEHGGNGDKSLIDINLSEVVGALNEIKEAVREIKDAFDPLTKAFANEESAIHAMVNSNVGQLEELISKFKEVHEMVDSLNNKDFNITNVISQKSSASESVNALRNQAKVLLDVTKQLFDAQNTVFNSNKAVSQAALLQSGGVVGSSLYELTGFDPDGLSKKIAKSGSEAKLREHVATLEYYKDVILGIVKELNKVSPGIIDSDSILFKLNGVQKAASSNALVQQNDTTDNGIQNFADKIIAERAQIEEELKLIRQQIEDVFNFGTIEPDLSNVQSITNSIYQQFVELQDKIKALDFKIEMPNVDGIMNAVKVIKQEGEAAENATPKKNDFTAANQKLAESMEKTGEVGKVAAAGVEAEAGAIVEASDAWDKIKHVTDADGKPVSKTLTGTTVRQKAIETESQYYTYEDGEEVLQAVTIIKDFKKRASELKKEADKISLAQKTVDKFISQFESKTSGQAGAIAGFADLKNFKIESLDDIDKATQKMIALDSEYNKITKSFRQGTKSMNPFVNAITGIDEVENKIQEVELAFVQLIDKPDELSNEINTLRPLLDKMKSFIGEDVDGNKIITDIYGLSEAYGALNVALRQAKSNIDIQKKISSFQSKDVGFGLDLEKQLSVLTKQQAQWEKNGQLTDGLRQSIDDMFVSLSKVTNASELSIWKKQWSILKDEVSETKYKIDAAKKAQDAINAKEVGDREYWDKERKRAISGLITPEKRPELEQLKAYMLQQASVTKEGVEEQYSAIMTIVTNKNKALQKLMSASGASEKQYWQDEYSAWFGAWNALDENSINDFFSDAGNQAILGEKKVGKFNEELEKTKILSAQIKDKASADAIKKKEDALLEDKTIMKEIVYDSKFTLDKDKQFALLSKQQAQWAKNGQLTDEVSQTINSMLDSLARVTDADELAIWKKQWSIVKDEVMETKYQMDAVKKSQAAITKADAAVQKKEAEDSAYWDNEFKYSLNNLVTPEKRPELEQLKVYMLQQAKMSKESVEEQYDAIMTIVRNKNDALQKLMSAKGPNEKQYWQDEYSAWFGAWNKLDKDVVNNFFADAGNSAILGADKIDKFNTELERSKILSAKIKDQEYKDGKKEQDKVNKENQNYGKADFNSLNKFSESVHASIRDLQSGGGVSVLLADLVAEFDSAYAKVDAMRKQFNDDPSSVTDDMKTQFQDSVYHADSLRKKITEILTESQKLQNLGKIIAVDGVQVSDINDLQSAMMNFANSAFNGSAKLKGFNKDGSQMYVTLDKGANAVEDITIALNEATGHLQAFSTGTGKVTNEWSDFTDKIAKGVKQVAGMYIGLHEGVQAARTGVNYVKEIDLAMTELKKVTDETDEAYKEFLNDAGGASAIIGSTIRDFTEATATFARLGYSMEESTSMAETAIIYKNVADGLDTVEESSESIISTMMAFGIEANDTMSIIDRFNAVGNNFAITSAGIGDALQRSASALYESGNTIDESIALVTAANSVIQNPEQVGKTLADYKVA